MNEFEKHIKENRDKFDVEEPRIGFIWQGIQEKKQDSSTTNIRRISYFKIAGIAASLLLAITLFFWTKKDSAKLVSEESSIQKELSLADISSDLANVESNYLKMVSDKMNQIHLDNINKEEFAEIFEELDQLDKINKEFRQDIPQFGYNEQLIKTLLKYYERKIRILERLAREIDKKQYDENIKKEKWM